MTIHRKFWQEERKLQWTKKATTRNKILPKMLKMSYNIFSEIFTEILKWKFLADNFPNNLKLVDITPVFKRKDPLNKEKYSHCFA